MRFRTDDVARVESTWRQYVPSAALHDVDRRRFFFDWHAADLGMATFVRYDLAAEVRSTAQPEDQLIVCRIEGSTVRVHSDREDLDAGRPWITDGPLVQAHWERGARVSALVFDTSRLQRLARAISGDDALTLRASDLSPRSARTAVAWDRMFAYLARGVAELDEDDDGELLRAELARHAAATTLATFSLSGPPARHRAAQAGPAPATVRRALAFIAENAHRPITVDDVAAAVHISTRGLQYAFRRALDTTPAERLRQARLDGAHRELRSGAPTTVAAVARRWGFSHPSRFAVAYRESFGVLPSETAATHRR